MAKILSIILIVVILGGISGYMFLSQRKTSISIDNISPTPNTIQPSPSFSEEKEKNDLQSGGSSYLDTAGIFSFLYPNDYTLDTQDPKHIRIYKKGDTQRPQSEMSDGALLVFEPVTLQGKSLETFVDTRIKESTADGTSEIIEAKKTITHTTYPGFSYSLQGLGTSQNLVLQKDKNSPNAVVITYSISDPQNKGYQKEVDAVLASIKLLK
jgi:hypothetical protein